MRGQGETERTGDDGRGNRRRAGEAGRARPRPRGARSGRHVVGVRSSPAPCSIFSTDRMQIPMLSPPAGRRRSNTMLSSAVDPSRVEARGAAGRTECGCVSRGCVAVEWLSTAPLGLYAAEGNVRTNARERPSTALARLCVRRMGTPRAVGFHRASFAVIFIFLTPISLRAPGRGGVAPRTPDPTVRAPVERTLTASRRPSQTGVTPPSRARSAAWLLPVKR